MGCFKYLPIFTYTAGLPFIFVLSQFPAPKSIPLLHNQIPSKTSISGKKNESTQKLFVNPVATELAPNTPDLETITDALADGLDAFELVT